jgi:peptide-methionine (R)-S-oxide reductase
MNNDDWKSKLTTEQYKVLREKGTEAPFSGDLLYNDKQGDYVCAVCGSLLFNSDAKYESTTPGLIGWPSFSELTKNSAVTLLPDNRYGMQRTEVICKNCGSHLGHLFPDSTSPSGDHYCINSISLGFKDKTT